MQLAQLLTRLAKGYERAWSQILLEAGRIPVTDPTQVDQEAWKKYLVEQANITAVGAGAEQHVRFKTLGRNDFKCRIADGTLSTLSEDEFAADAIAASADLQRRFQFEILLLKDECWGLGAPEITKERQRRKQEAARDVSQ